MDKKQYSTGSSSVSLQLPVWLMEIVNQYAIDSRITRNALIRMAIEDMLKKANRLPK